MNAIRPNDLTGKEMLEIRKIGKSIEDEEFAMIYGTALMARRRAGEKELRFDDVLEMSVDQARQWIDMDDATPLAEQD